ncbi:MAG: T9SS type A sorting domain-containing protein [Bacteroidales bacterium]|nr:T9SS type A sorting domain-containing protein [Bacteroidales bacterium]
MAHEFGHNFGLDHSYNSEIKEINHPDFLWDLFGTTTQPWCIAPVGYVCYHDAGWSMNPYDPTNTSTNNIMGGTKDACHFTALQCGRIHRALSVSTLRNYAYGYSTIPLTLTSNTTFDMLRKFYQNIVVDSNVTLTVTCKLEMVDSACIIVRRGGKLVIDGGEITSAGKAWKGVIVEGNADSARLERCQGTIILQNGATISNALCGVYIQGGGIIKATNAYFTNDSQGVVMREYNHAQVVSSYLPIRKTYFRNCSFNVNNNAFFASYGTFTHVSLTGIQDAAFVSCSFTDTRNNQYQNLLGTGIYAFTSSLDMEDGNNYMYTPVRNYFSGLGTGIYVQSSFENTSRIQCCRFTNNSSGIHATNADYLICRDNIFEIEHPIFGVAGNTHGIILEVSTQYTIYNNLFTGVGTYSIGISINNSGTHNNLVKNNTFEDLYIACYVTGCNGGDGGESVSDIKGLVFRCNKFMYQSVCDIYVNGDAYIHPIQGAMWNAAGNYFTLGTNIVNMGTGLIQYYYDINESGHLPFSSGSVLSRSTQGNDCGNYGYNDGYSFTGTISLINLEQQYLDKISQCQILATEYINTYGYIIPTVFSGGQESDLTDLLNAQWDLTEICNTAIYKITSDSVFNSALYETWLDRAETIGGNYALMENYFHYNVAAYNSYRNSLLSRTPNTQENANFIRLYDLRHSVSNSDLGWRNMDSSSVNVLRQIAENRDRAGLLAKSVLHAFYGETYRYDSLHPLFPIVRCGNNYNDLPPMESSSPMADGVEKIQDKDMILVVQPNPAKDVINVTIEGAILSSVILYDMQGRIVWRKDNVGNNVIIPCAKIGKGLYFLSATANEKQFTRKIIVE